LQAVDGSALRLHEADELKEYFGGQKGGDDMIPMARLSSSFDVQPIYRSHLIAPLSEI